jgi:hypothetical protein
MSVSGSIRARLPATESKRVESNDAVILGKRVIGARYCAAQNVAGQVG